MDREHKFSELGQFTIDADSVRLLNRRYCTKNMVVVLGKVDPKDRKPVVLGCLDPGNAGLVAEVAGKLGREVHPARLNDYEIMKALSQGYPEEDETASERLVLKPVKELTFSPGAAVGRLIDEILGVAVHRRATDIHIETYENDVDVRLRIDGTLHSISTALDPENIASAISRLKILADLDIAERRRSQDGRITAIYEADGKRRNIDLRLSIVPGPCGEDAVMRILDSAKPLIGLEKLGLGPGVMTQFEEIISNPEGLILVTGPTGSGKTTTLYSALLRINTAANKILTVEDPIEYSFEKINQKQITGTMDYADYARSFMRQNPDIILIGEIRDEETADAALRAAQTGHLVLSTLHTNDAIRTISRLMMLKIDPSLIAGSLLGALSQRLVRRLCESCRREAPPDERERRIFGLPEGKAFFRADGCAACGDAGYQGRMGVYELFVPDEEMADMIASGQPVHVIRARAIEKGMKTLLSDAMDKARAGLTSLSEIRRVVPYRIIASEQG